MAGLSRSTCTRQGFRHSQNARCLRPDIVLTSSQTRSRHRVCAGLQDGAGNLGQLSQFASNSASEDLSWAVQRVSPESFANRGLYVDTPVVLASGFLLLLLLALSMQRILGLDRLIAEFMLKQQEERKQNTRAAKEALERSWSQEGRGSQDDPPSRR